MTSRQATIKNEYGIHCRPSAVIATEAKELAGEITVADGRGNTADPRSIMALLSLGLTQGRDVTVTVDGPDEEGVCARLVELLETNFDFPKRGAE